jgi:quinolinate synthase
LGAIKVESVKEINQEIEELKKKHDALVFSHYYEDGQIQDIADELGDSLFLAQRGAEVDKPVVLMAGVVFMAESIKILSPDKKVLIPDTKAGCSLVQHSPIDKYTKWRNENPDAIMVTYVNSSAEVKALTDVTCTSTNAEQVIKAIPKDKKILFGPDENLGRYLVNKTGRQMELWPGSCEVHVLFSSKKLLDLKAEHPDALVIAHPECEEPVLNLSDKIGSTSFLLNEVKTNPRKKFIVATEEGIFHQMKKLRPDAELIQAPARGNCACNECPYMKMNTLVKVRDALKSLSPEVSVDPDLIEKARRPLHRMMQISRGEAVNWSSYA